MCPRPEWAKTDPERWQRVKDRRGGRMIIMTDYISALMDKGRTRSEAFWMMEHMIETGGLDLEKGLDEATERWVAARKERYGY